MSILSKMTLFFNNQLVNFPCHICGGRVDPCGFDFCVNEGEGLSPSFVCYSCTKNLRTDLIAIQSAAFKFARSGLWQGCGDAEKVSEDVVMPWMRGTTREQAAAAKTATGLPTNEEYIAEKNAHGYRVECELLIRELLEDRIKRERLQRSEDLLEGIEDANRQGMSLKEIEMLEFHRDHYVISYHREGPMGWLV